MTHRRILDLCNSTLLTVFRSIKRPATWDHGVCLAQRVIENRYILCIFEVNGFFVEAIYSRRNNRVNAILPIADLPEWEAYVDQTLTQLLKLS